MRGVGRRLARWWLGFGLGFGRGLGLGLAGGARPRGLGLFTSYGNARVSSLLGKRKKFDKIFAIALVESWDAAKN